MQDEEKLKHRQSFVGEYESFWKFPARGDPQAAKYWFALMDDVPAARIPELIFELHQAYEGKSGPRRALCEDTWKRIKGRSRWGASAPVVQCSMCEGHGLFVVPANRELVKGVDRWTFAEPSKLLSWWAFPCRCSAGAAHKAKARLDDQVLNDAWATALDFRTAAGCSKEEERQVSRGEFLALDRPPVSPIGIARDVLWSSLSRAGMREGQQTRAEAVTRGALERIERNKTGNLAGNETPTPPKESPVAKTVDEVVASGFAFGFNAVEETPRLPGGYKAEEFPW